jgi:membrane-bound lytic murein transglycosylase B
MAGKQDFSTDEWKSIVAAAPMVGLAVASASPNGPFGVMKEMFSVGMAMAEMVNKGSSSPLIAALIEDVKQRATKPERPEGVTNAEQAKQAALAHIKAVSEVVGGKASADEAREFRQWLMTVGERVAEASNEGGFFGFGGTRVSEEEKAMLAQIAQALGVGQS